MSKPRALLIAEKPSYMRDIEGCYNAHLSDMDYDIDFMAQHGHAMELLTPDQMDEAYKTWDESLLPIVPENMGGFKYRVMSNSKDVVKEAKERIHSGEYDYVIHAGDPDQEGELLTRLLLQGAKNKLPVLRLWPNDTTDAKLFQALKNMRSDDEPEYKNLYHAGKLRQHADWRFGMNGSRAAGARFRTKEKVAVGRVMTSVLAMIVDREDALNKYVEKITYGVKLDFAEGYSGQLFRYETEIDEKTGAEKRVRSEIYYDTKEEAEQHAARLGENGIITQIDRKNKKENAPKLYDLAEAQIDAAKMGYSADQTLEIIQGLYDKHKLTYPRTDCCVMSSTEDFNAIFKALETLPEFASAVSTAKNELPKILKTRKYVDDKELQKHGHSALVPTTESVDLSDLSDDEEKIYMMVARRFLAIFQPPLIEQETWITTDLNGDLFLTKGKIILDPGFTTFLGVNKEETPLPKLAENQKVRVVNKSVSEKKTTPPKRFTNGTIIQAMKDPKKYLDDKEILKGLEDFHVGTSATRAEIIKKLNTDKFIVTKKNTLYPTEWGMFFIHKLHGIDITRVDMTGKWEHLLEQVRQGDVSLNEGETIMRDESIRMVTSILGMEQYSFGEVSTKAKIIGSCPNCGKDLIETERSFFCADYAGECGRSVRKYVTKLTPLTKEEAFELLSGEIISKTVQSEKVDETTKKKIKREWTTGIRLEENEEGKLNKLAFVPLKTNIACPDCGETLYKDGMLLKCRCGFNMWTTVAKKDLTELELHQLITSGQTKEVVKGLRKRDGGTFEAKLKFERDEDGKVNLSFIFDNSKKPGKKYSKK